MTRAAYAVAACLLAAGAARASDAGTPQAQIREWVMATTAEVRVYDAPDLPRARAALERVMAELRAIDRLMAVQRADSDVSRMNRDAATRPVGVDRRVIDVLEASIAVSRRTGGAFDVTVLPAVLAWGFTGPAPARPRAPVPRPAGYRTLEIDRAAGTVRFGDPRAGVDLGGIAKGYALDRAREILRAAAVRSAWLDLGGEIATLGRPPGGGRWRVAIRHPRRADVVLGIVEVEEAAVSTSGDGERFLEDGEGRTGHVFDARTGLPATGVSSATVVASSATLADAYSTAAIAMGAAFEPLAHTLGVFAVLGRIDPRGSVRLTVTPGLDFTPA